MFIGKSQINARKFVEISNANAEISMKNKLLFYHQVAATRVIFNLILAGGGKRKMEPELFPSESPPRSAADKTSP